MGLSAYYVQLISSQILQPPSVHVSHVPQIITLWTISVILVPVISPNALLVTILAQSSIALIVKALQLLTQRHSVVLIASKSHPTAVAAMIFPHVLSASTHTCLDQLESAMYASLALKSWIISVSSHKDVRTQSLITPDVSHVFPNTILCMMNVPIHVFAWQGLFWKKWMGLQFVWAYVVMEFHRFLKNSVMMEMSEVATDVIKIVKSSLIMFALSIRPVNVHFIWM